MMNGLMFSFLLFICDLFIRANGQSTFNCCPCINEQSSGPFIKPTIGTKGEKGDAGAKGVRGNTGLPGLSGPKGYPGHTGVPGIPGLDGHKGDRGLPGRQGAVGLAGLHGMPGEKGDTGTNGERGATGIFGLPGARGPKGYPGHPGVPGLPGRDGIKGEKGVSTPVNQGQDKIYRLNDFIAFGNKSYWFSILPLKWQKAQEACGKLGADLVSIESYEEDTLLTVAHIELATKYVGLWNSFFTGGIHTHAVGTDNRWVWFRSNASFDITYNRYTDEQAFNSVDQNQKCLVIETRGSLLGVWAKASCNSAHQFVCEKDNGQ